MHSHVEMRLTYSCSLSSRSLARQKVLGQVCYPKQHSSPPIRHPLVITGASDGIGKEFALQLAAAGFNILLVARNEAALTAVAAEIGAFIIDMCIRG